MKTTGLWGPFPVALSTLTPQHRPFQELFLFHGLAVRRLGMKDEVVKDGESPRFAFPQWKLQKAHPFHATTRHRLILGETSFIPLRASQCLILGGLRFLCPTKVCPCEPPLPHGSCQGSSPILCPTSSAPHVGVCVCRCLCPVPQGPQALDPEPGRPLDG